MPWNHWMDAPAPLHTSKVDMFHQTGICMKIDGSLQKSVLFQPAVQAVAHRDAQSWIASTTFSSMWSLWKDPLVFQGNAWSQSPVSTRSRETIVWSSEHMIILCNDCSSLQSQWPSKMPFCTLQYVGHYEIMSERSFPRRTIFVNKTADSFYDLSHDAKHFFFRENE